MPFICWHYRYFSVPSYPMKNFHLLLPLLVIMLFSCRTSRDAGKSQTIYLKPVEITVPSENPYRASATKKFDLIHTRLEVRFDYEKQRLHGKATLTLRPHFYPQSVLELDAKNFDLHEVSLMLPDGSKQPLRYTYDSLQISIQLPVAYHRTQELKVFIDYTAKPEERKTGGSAAIGSDKGLFFINPLGTDTTKPIQIWTQGETEHNSCWFPTLDKPNQKTTQEIFITRNKKFISLSNGILVWSKENADGTVTDYWRMSLPHAPYLVMMAVGDYAVYRDRWRDLDVTYYTERRYAPYARQIFGNTPEMMEFFSQKLGVDYPWAKYAQIVVRDYVSGAMENTSATVHGEFLQRNSRELLDETNEDIIAHELFHQWFGNLVTCESWSNLPLNESFATYGEYLWNEYKYGREYADYKQHQQYYDYLFETQQGKNVDLIRFYYDEKEDMFDRHSYEKGGLLLHYLRHIVGDDAFFRSLELYLRNNSFKAVEIHHLRLAFEEVTGEDLNWFFNQWFFAKGHPVLDIRYRITTDSAYVNIAQKNSVEEKLVYRLPLQIAIYSDTGMQLHEVVLHKPEQTFSFPVSGTVSLVDVDPGRVVLCERTENKTPQQYIVQLERGTYKAKAEAIDTLSMLQKSNRAARDAIARLLHAPFFKYREMAVEKIHISKDNNDTLLQVIRELALRDPKSAVRAVAVTKLSKFALTGRYTDVFEQALGDSSYQVAAEALKALAKAEPARALLYAERFEKDENLQISNAVADVYSREAGKEKQQYFEDQIVMAKPIRKYYLFYHYANFLTRMEKNEMLTGINTIAREGAIAKEWVKQAAEGALRRFVSAIDDKKKQAHSNMSKEDSITARLTYQQLIADYDTVIAAAKDALQRLGNP
ncbi:MAG: M1 family metallopeptidase [Chitinophagales bacterium]|nr:M1 family metallopeptidase [Chitinophagales bacterium]MDW8417858.1 M1 family metallopeptidase [Chitinophagales bacterium]